MVATNLLNCAISCGCLGKKQTTSDLVIDYSIPTRLFEFKYFENIHDVDQLCDLLGVKDAKALVLAERCLDSWLSYIMNGTIRPDLLELVCPNCLTVTLKKCDVEGEKVCVTCGMTQANLYANNGESFDTSLPFDVTLSPESPLGYNRGLGDTLKPSLYLGKLLYNSNISFSNFKRDYPDIAEQLDGGPLWVDSRVFWRFGDIVKICSVDEMFNAQMAVFNSHDVGLRKFKTQYAIVNDKNDLKAPLVHGYALCLKYGINSKDKDQPFYGSLGVEIRRLKECARVTGKHIGPAKLSETAFYITLLRFKRKDLSVSIKNALHISYDLINSYGDYLQFQKQHQKPNGSQNLLLELERRFLFSSKED